MENKKILLIAGIVVIVLLIMVTAGTLILLLKSNDQPPVSNTNQPPVEATTTPGLLPATPTADSTGDSHLAGQQQTLQKEKQFIASYYQPVDAPIEATVTAASFPLANVKEDLVNYRDFSRKLAIDELLPAFTDHGFAVIDNPFPGAPANWQDAYAAINDKSLPVFVTSDALAGLYQDTLTIVYKEVEQQKFYPALWYLLRDLFNQTKTRYEARLQRFGIESDTITEANRLELGYLATALQLLRPEPDQVKESFGVSQQFFTGQEAETYTFAVPTYLRDEVNKEVSLVTQRPALTLSPLFGYNQSYSGFTIPPQYQSSEKLKNYYLAITWLKEKQFPLFSQAADCPTCLLDEQDHQIHFLASLYLTNALANNQDWKNQWANIYKSVAFFQGLESDLTYLDYQAALVAAFGPDYNLNDLFDADNQTIKDRVKKVQTILGKFEFLSLLSGRKNNDRLANFRLLRSYHLPEETLFADLTNDVAGDYLAPTSSGQPIPVPYTSCPNPATLGLKRCWPRGLDVLNLLGSSAASNLLAEQRDDQYERYQQNLDRLKKQLAAFTQNTWHDSAYLSLLGALPSLTPKTTQGFPPFMQTNAWQKKSLNTSLAVWVNTHRPIIFERVPLESRSGFQAYFPYGYLEPQAAFYAQLLANVRMIKDGFAGLQIVSEADKPLLRLIALETVLENAITISQKELSNKLLAIEEFNFINGFEKQVETVTGDIKRQNLNNTYLYAYQASPQATLQEQLNGFKYIIVAYPDAEGRLLFAIGPIFNYTEGKNDAVSKAAWQQALGL